jgi:hypothetical protein
MHLESEVVVSDVISTRNTVYTCLSCNVVVSILTKHLQYSHRLQGRKDGLKNVSLREVEEVSAAVFGVS